MRSVGLLVDGPAAWGRPVPARGAGVYLVELPDPPDAAPLELARVGKWLERVPGLRLHGERPTSRVLSSVLSDAWQPGQAVVYVGATTTSIGGRVAALRAHVPGDRRPHADGQWLHLLRPDALGSARVWWASTDAPEEYLDAILDAFADAAGSGALPWANTRSPSGRRRDVGIGGSLLPAEERPVRPPTRVVDVPDGDAEGVRARPRGTGTTRRRIARPTATGAAATRPAGAPSAPDRSGRDGPDPGALTADGHARLESELEELIGARRPEVVARIRAAKELGDLKENADYTAAREEQSFLEGRIQAIEARLRNAVVVGSGPSGGAADGRARLGSEVDVDQAGDLATYRLVGAAESAPAEGRISVDSPVGKALLGARAGDTVVVRTPRGEASLTVVAIR